MNPDRQGSVRFFRLWSIDVHVHWSWFVVAIYSVSSRAPRYESPAWALAEYLALFGVVLMHEFGHALACRQVGGRADQIVLWPLGGVAYVAPPARPGATLWSIAAGPLVNVVLLPVFLGIYYGAAATGALDGRPDLHIFLRTLIWMDVVLLIFNLLPVYPLDGGQILRSLLWYPLGKARSLLAATGVGLLGGVALVGLAVWLQSIWTGIMALFMLSTCWKSFQQAKELRQVEQLPRRAEFRCPECRASPPRGNYWLCPACRQAFDPFVTGAQCPHCATPLDRTVCPDCGSERDQRTWDASIRDA